MLRKYFVVSVHLLPLQPLHKTSHVLLGSSVSWNTTELRVDVESTLELQEVPVLLDSLAGGALLLVLHNHIVQEHDLRQLHRYIILVSSRLQIYRHSGSRIILIGNTRLSPDTTLGLMQSGGHAIRVMIMSEGRADSYQ